MCEAAMARRYSHHLLVILLYTGMTMLFLNPLSRHAVGALTDPVDPLLNTWIVSWDIHALLTHPGKLFNANIFYAYPDALAFSETLLGSALMVFPIHLAVNLPVFTHNLFLFGGFVFGGYNAYLLGRYVTRDHLAAFLVGTIFVFNAYRLSLLPKAQLMTLQWLPLGLLYLARISSRGRWQDGLMLALFLVLQMLTTIYYGLFMGLMLAILAPVFLLAHRRNLRRKLLSLALAAVASLAIIVPYTIPYFRVSQTFNLERTLQDAIPFAASLQQWLMVSSKNLVWGRWLGLADPPMVGPYPIDFLFPGLLALLLAVLALFFIRRQRLWLVAALVLVGVAFVLSLGPVLMMTPLTPKEPLITLPYAWLHNHLPGFKALRAPARFAGFVMLGLGLLAGMGLAALRERGVKPVFLMGIIALTFFEALAWPATSTRSVPQNEAIPPVYRWLSQQSEGVTVDLPAALPQQRRLPERWLWPQYFSTYHWNDTPTGYSGFVPPRHESLIDILNRFPDEQVMPLYRAMTVRYILLHKSFYDEQRWHALRSDIDVQPAIEVLWEDDETLVVGLSQQDPPADFFQGEFYLPPSGILGESYQALLVLQSAEVPGAIPPGEPARGWASWQREDGYEYRASFTVVLPFLVQGVSAVNALLPTPEEPGDYVLQVWLEHPVQVAAQAQVSLSDAAPREQALPLQLQEVATACGEEDLKVQLEWKALGWVDTPQTVFLHLLDDSGERIGQLDEPMVPDPTTWLPGLPMTTEHQIAWASDATAADSLRVGLYAWSDRFQTIIPARFLGPDGRLVDSILVPVCQEAQSGS